MDLCLEYRDCLDSSQDYKRRQDSQVHSIKDIPKRYYIESFGITKKQNKPLDHGDGGNKDYSYQGMSGDKRPPSPSSFKRRPHPVPPGCIRELLLSIVHG